MHGPTVRLISGLLIVLCLVAGCHPAQQIISDETTTTTDKLAVTYDIPETWKKIESPRLAKFSAPEGDATVAVVYVNSADSAEQAAELAWKEYNPKFDRKVRIISPTALSGGWDEKRDIEYVTSVAENALAQAYAYRKGSEWYVTLIDGDLGTLVKRQIAAWGVPESLVIAGYQSEDLTGKTAKKLTQKDIEQLLDFVSTSAKALKIPGVGIALVQDGKVLYEGGVGVTDIHSNEPVNADTLYMIASNTKGMTTLLLAKLVEMGKLNWDDKVIEHYPDFKLGDQKTSESVLIKHLMCACTGMPRKDFDWVFNSGPDVSAEVVFTDLANMQPTSDFGELFQYNNQMAAAAGYVAGHVLYPDMEIGAAYDKAMQVYVFDKLAMRNTTLSMSQAMANQHAKPHALDLHGNLTLISQTPTTGFNHTVVPYRPAGAAWSSPADMIKYVQNEISLGLSDNGEQLFAKEPLLARRTPFVEVGQDKSYGMGLENFKISGLDVIKHGGSMAGYKSNFYIFEQAKVGAVILTNSDEGYALTEPVAQRLVELLFNAKSSAEQQVAITVEQNSLYQQTQQNEFEYPGDPVVLSKLANSYLSPELGELDVVSEQGDVFFDTGVWRSKVGTKQNNDGTHSIVMLAPFFLGVELLVGESNGKQTLQIIYGQDEYTFTQVERTNR